MRLYGACDLHVLLYFPREAKLRINRYLLPIALVLALLLARWTGRPLPNSPPINEQTLQAVIADLTTIHALLNCLFVCLALTFTD